MTASVVFAIMERVRSAERAVGSCPVTGVARTSYSIAPALGALWYF